jgi:hypothetical protein
MKITAASHTDHHLTPAHVAFVLATFGDRTAFFRETVVLPDELPGLPCDLHGPKMGDAAVADSETARVVRGDRKGASRVCARAARIVRTVTVIGGPHEGECILYTAFGGPAASREPFDEAFADGKDPEGLAESVGFWAEHALSLPGGG